MNLLARLVPYALALIAAASASVVGAGVVTVDATLNSSSGGRGAAALELVAGQHFWLAADPYDTWSAGEVRLAGVPAELAAADLRGTRSTTMTRSNANGLIGLVYAVSGDDSGAAPGTAIGRFVGLRGDDRFAAPYAALVGQIGDGDLFLVGTAYSGIAASSGMLNLSFWDANATGNAGQISVKAMAEDLAVPEPSTAALAGAALAAATSTALGIRRRRRVHV